MKNPWLRPAPEYYPVKEIQSVSVEDRKTELKNFGIAKLKAVIAWPGTQKTVRLAAERQLKKDVKCSIKNLLPMGNIPTSERQTRPLTKIKDPELQKVTGRA